MRNVVPISREDESLEAASRWVLKIDNGQLSATEKAALGAWLDEDIRHCEVLLEVAAAWDKSDSLARLAELFAHDPAFDRLPSGRWHQGWAQGLTVAAGLAFIVICGLLLMIPGGDPLPPTMSAVYKSAVGERQTVLLPDGSEVVMNTNSQLTVTFTPSERLLHLSQGEILVRVAEDRSRPLSVVAGDRIIQAVGTEFVVEITNDHKIELIVTEGKVVIGVQRPVVAPRADDVDAGNTVVAPPVLAEQKGNVVSAGEAVTLSAADSVKKPVSADEIEVKLSWKEGRLIFRSEPLEKALQEVERYTTLEFVFLDESLRTRTLSGRFRAGDVEALLLSLRLNFGITHEFDGESRVLLSSL